MKRYFGNQNRAYAWAFCFALLFAAHAHAQSRTADMMRKKLAEISMVRDTLIEKKGQATKMIWEFNGQIKSLKDEIKSLQTSNDIVSYDQAISFPRIRYNLKLIQQLLAYISRLDEKSVSFEASAEKLEFLFQQADDGLRMAETLNHMVAEDLVNEIDRVLRKHIPEANNVLVDMDTRALKAPKAIWQEIEQEK